MLSLVIVSKWLALIDACLQRTMALRMPLSSKFLKTKFNPGNNISLNTN